MRLEDNAEGETPQLKKTLRIIFDNRQEGDILMDVPPDLTWKLLEKLAADRDGWKERVKLIKDTAPSHW